jgi:cytochrome c-type biogenesis protein CcmE
MAKHLDDELAEAAGLTSDDSPATTAAAAGETPKTASGEKRDDPRGNRRPLLSAGLGLLVALLAMVGVIVCLFLFAFEPAAVYAMPVDQLLAQGQDAVGRRVRVDGELVPGSLVKRDQPCEYRFRMRNKGGSDPIEVRYPQCVVPDTFRDVPQGGVEVSAEGQLADGGHFEASLIMAKCSSKYDPETHTMDGAQAQAAPEAEQID